MAPVKAHCNQMCSQENQESRLKKRVPLTLHRSVWFVIGEFYARSLKSAWRNNEKPRQRLQWIGGHNCTHPIPSTATIT